MKVIKCLSMMMLSGAILVSGMSSVNVKAAENGKINVVAVGTNKINDSSKTTDYLTSGAGIQKMQQEVHEKHKNLKIVGTTTEYLKIENVSTNSKVVKTKVTKYSEDQYIQEMKTEKLQKAKNGIHSNSTISVNTGGKYSWIMLRLEYDQPIDNNDHNYHIYGYFQWLNSPFFTGKDFIALTHDSNSVIHQETLEGDIEYYDKISHNQYQSEFFTNNTPGVDEQSDDVGYGYSVSSTPDLIPMGYIGVSASKMNSQSNITFIYEHQEISVSISPCLSFDGDSVSVNAAAVYEPADIGTHF